MKLAREGASHCARLLWRRVARRLYARHQQGNSEARARVERAAPDRRPHRNGSTPRFSIASEPDDSEYDTEEFYFELLRDIGRSVELRVVVDIIAGASAGGIVGTMLARALSHDLRMEKMRDLWLDNADVTVLLSPDTRAGAWSKWFLKPFLWGAAKAGMLGAIRDLEVRQKLSLVVRSRWFRPPLDGRIMAGLMFDAVASMGRPAQPTQSLLPSGHTLDLFVSLTDFTATTSSCRSTIRR